MASEPSFFHHLRERKLVQWALAYLAGAWAVLESAGYVGDQFGWPTVVGQVLIVLVAFGFFFTLVLAWYHGEKGRQRISGPELLILVVLLVGAGATASALRERAQRGPSSPATSRAQGAVPSIPADGRPSVAVLPFANLSADPSDAYLPDGFHEEVLSHLAKIAGLRPVSRTSVMEYREPDRNLRQIAAELGVDFVLEGSVRKVLDQLRVTVLLVDAPGDQQVWTETYDERFALETLLDTESEIARRVAASLQTRLTPREDALMAARPTENLEAYQAFLRGRYFQDLPHFTEDDVARALREFERAVELDPAFALAWMELANAHAQEVFYWTDTSEERKELARAAAQRAMALESDAPEVHLGLGLFHLWLERAPEKALVEIALAEEGLPNEPRVYSARAAVYENQGRFQEAIEETEKALNLSPRDPSVITDLGLFHWFARDCALAEAYAQEAINLAPDQLWPNLTKVLAVWTDRGPTPETEALLEGLPHSEGWVIWGRFWQRMMLDQYDDALRVLSDPEFDWYRIKMWAQPRSLMEAFTYRAMGMEEEATTSFEAARIALEAALAASPQDARLHSALGLAYAGLGREDEAIREGERGMVLLPVEKDAVYGLAYPWDLAAIHAMLGNAPEAVALLGHLLEIPGWVSPAFIEGDFRLDPIRETQEFRTLVEHARPEPG
jgi:serine/threonine-protein kinase